MQAFLCRSHSMAALHLKPAVSQQLQALLCAPLSRGAATAAALKEGDELPDFELPADDGRSIKSKDMVAQGGAVLYAFPRAGTSGCTTQAKAYRDNKSSFEGKGYHVYGISADPPSAQAAWKREHNFNYPFLSDESMEVLKALGMSPDGKSVKRSHVVVEKGGRIKQLSIGVSPMDSVPQALKAVQGN